jgi:hypothetical protein
LSNGGVIGAPNNVFGEIRDDFNDPIPAQKPPTWYVNPNNNGVVAGATHLNQVKNTTIIYGGTTGTVARYTADLFALSGNKTVTFANPTGVSASAIEIYVSGSLSTKGGGNPGDTSDGSFVVSPGVNVKIFIAGNVSVGGNALDNRTGLAENLSLIGVNATANGTVSTTAQTWTFGGSSQFVGTVYAPGADVVLNGGGNNGTYIGSIVSKTAELKGNVEIRYDEALAQGGRIIGFQLMSWFEDIKKDGNFSL